LGIAEHILDNVSREALTRAGKPTGIQKSKGNHLVPFIGTLKSQNEFSVVNIWKLSLQNARRLLK